MSIFLKIQRIARMVNVVLDGFGVQLVARERFNCGMCLCLNRYIYKSQLGNSIIMQVIDIYFCVN
jgi:hypothetical protein